MTGNIINKPSMLHYTVFISNKNVDIEFSAHVFL